MRKLLAALAVLAVIPSLGLADSLTTTFQGGNGQDGAMFDLTGLNAAGIRITGFDYRLYSGGGPGTFNTIEVYSVTDRTTYVGKESNSALWTLMGTDTVETKAAPAPINVNIGGLEIYQGETIGLYFTEIGVASTSVAYTNGPLGAFANPDLRFEDRGVGKSYPFGSTFDPRIWNGTIYYDVIPEPASLALLGLGALALLRRR